MSRWLFDRSALSNTPSQTFSNVSLQKEMCDRARGIEYLFRVGVQLQLSLSAILTAATYFHRLYMRISMEDIHRYEAAGACIFLSTKAEECGRRLKDVCMVCMQKSTNNVPSSHNDSSPELNRWQGALLRAEEFLMESLCFDFTAHHPHADLADFFESTPPMLPNELEVTIEDFAWSIATDSFRTPLCTLFPSSVIACSSLGIALVVADSSDCLTLDQLLQAHRLYCDKPDDSERYFASLEYPTKLFCKGMEHLKCTLEDVADAMLILLQFYRSQHVTANVAPQDHFLAPLANLQTPMITSDLPQLYTEDGMNGRHTVRVNGHTLSAKTEDVFSQTELSGSSLTSIEF